MTAPFDKPFHKCYNTNSTHNHGEHMTIQSISLNSFIPSSNIIVGGVAIDGYSDGRPVQLVRIGGQIKPAIGTQVKLSFGTAVVLGYTPTSLRVEVIEFNDDFEWINADETDIMDAEEYVERLNQCVVRNVQSSRRTFTRLYKSEVTDRLSDRNHDRMVATFPMPEPTEVHVMLDPNYPYPSDTQVIARVISDNRETPTERKARIKRERAMATKAANDLLMRHDHDIAPADILAEISACFDE